MTGGLAHWDGVPRTRRDVGDIRSTWRDLGDAAGATAIGVQRIEIDPGGRPGPLHVHGAEEEIFAVLAGTGLVVLDDAAHEVGPGDVIVCRALGPLHTFVAGATGLDVLAFGENIDPPLVRLPRAGVVRRASFTMVEAGPPDAITRDAQAGPFEPPALAPRPACVVATGDVAPECEERAGYRGEDRAVAAAAGAVRTGLRDVRLDAGQLSCPPHHHSGEHELFLVLDGDGVLLLHDQRGAVTDEHPLRAGSIVSRPAGTGVAHALRAGDAGMSYLAYGTRDPNEIVFYPRSRKAWIGRTLVRVEPVADYWDGEA